MSRFWAGFGVATILWAAAAAYLVLVAGFGPPSAVPCSEAAADPHPAVPALAEADERQPRRRTKRAAARALEREATPVGEATTGDDLGENEARTIDMDRGGGEQQLSAAQIEAGFDGAMGRIRRCLVLMAGDDPVTGRLTFGLRVAPTGEVRAVQLTGPAAATTGEAGDCLRSAARAIRFEVFDGPEMVVRYPITLE